MVQELIQPVIPLEPCLIDQPAVCVMPSAVDLTSGTLSMLPSLQLDPNIIQPTQLITHQMASEAQGGVAQNISMGGAVQANDGVESLLPPVSTSLANFQLLMGGGNNAIMLQGQNGALLQIPSSVLLQNPGALATLVNSLGQTVDNITTCCAASGTYEPSTVIANHSLISSNGKTLPTLSGLNMISQQPASGTETMILPTHTIQTMHPVHHTIQGAPVNCISDYSTIIGLSPQNSNNLQFSNSQNLILNYNNDSIDQSGGASLSSLTLMDPQATSASHSSNEMLHLIDHSQASASQNTIETPTTTPVILKCPPVAHTHIASPARSCSKTCSTSCSTSTSHSVPQSVPARINLPDDGTLTSAIQKGIPVSIVAGANPSSIVLNQVFVPVYSNTEKGPVIELVPLKPST